MVEVNSRSSRASAQPVIGRALRANTHSPEMFDNEYCSIVPGEIFAARNHRAHDHSLVARIGQSFLNAFMPFLISRSASFASPSPTGLNLRLRSLLYCEKNASMFFTRFG